MNVRCHVSPGTITAVSSHFDCFIFFFKEAEEKDVLPSKTRGPSDEDHPEVCQGIGKHLRVLSANAAQISCSVQ